MKPLLLALLLLGSAALYAQEAIPANTSPLTQIFLKETAAVKDGIVPGYVYKIFGGHTYISALIKVEPDFKETLLDPQGVRIGTKAGDIWTAQIPVENIVAFMRTPGIAYIQLDEPIAPMLDSARKATHVDSVHAGLGLSAPFYGKGVVVGVVDAGFDFTSPMLWDTGGVAYRVKRIWAQKAASGTPPAGFVYGKEYTDSALMVAAGTDQPTQSHASHVVGIAAGSGFTGSNNTRYRGMAPLSDLVLVGIMPAQQQWINTGGSDIVDGVNYVFKYAASVSRPAVVNLSWGASLGPHDGTSLCSQALNNLCGAGKIFVTSAGNSGGTKVHLKKTFTTADTVVSTFPVYSSLKKTWVDIWGEAGKTFCARVSIYDGQGGFITATPSICPDGQLHQYIFEGFNGDSCYLSIIANPADFNGKPHTFISINDKGGDAICVTVKATSGTINMWNTYVEAPNGYIVPFTNGGQAWATAGDTLQSISDNAAGSKAIAVAAYATKVAWQPMSGAANGYPGSRLGAIAPFSSVGPAADGRTKPDISAPGNGVVSTVNSFDSNYPTSNPEVVDAYHFPVTNRDYHYAIFSGTSMSSPVTAGIIALMLEANHTLTPEAVRDILTQTAIHDNFTGTAINNTWGGGKINAYQALKMSMQYTGVGGVAKNALACTAYPNPNSGSFTISYLGEQPAILQITLYDVSGRLVLAQSWAVNAGYNRKVIGLGNNVAKGAYLARITGANGGASTLRIMIQ